MIDTVDTTVRLDSDVAAEAHRRYRMDREKAPPGRKRGVSLAINKALRQAWGL